MSKESNENLELLANALASNYVNASIEHKENRTGVIHKFNSNFTTIDFKSSESDTSIDHLLRYRRVIMVIGAGASHNAFENIPLGAKAIEEIQKDFKFGKKEGGEDLTFYDIINADEKWLSTNKGFAAIHHKYKLEHNKLKLYVNAKNRTDDIDFETALALLTHFFPPAEIRDKLHALYSQRFGPTLYYDIISHLFKHRFVDIIINFNFDELLDQSIEDELGNNKYISMLSDGDCQPMEDLLINQKIKQPIYIKPHGTFSHKSTMRFTKDQYDQLPYDMKVMLGEILTCEEETALAKSPILIVAGFALASIEFNELLAEIPEDFIIFCLHWSRPVVKHKKKKIKDNRKEGAEEETPEDRIKKYTNKAIFKNIYLEDFKSLNKEQSPLYDIVFEKLWKAIESKFIIPFKPRNTFAPRNIIRHKIIQGLFGNRQFWASLAGPKKHCREYFHSPEYFQDRAAIEIFMEAIKSPNLVAINNLLTTKPGFYFSQYYTESTKLNKDKPTQRKQVYSFVEFLAAMKLRREGSENVVQVPADYSLDALLESKVISQKLIAHIKANRSNLDQLFVNFQKSKSSIIVADYQSRYYLAYKEYDTYQLLTTHLALQYKILQRLEKKWTHLLIVENSGDFLDDFQYYIQKNVKQITLILADSSKYYNNPKKIAALYRRFPKVKIDPLLFMDSKIHDQHMTIFLSSRRNDIDSIYYFQKGVTNHYSPIEVSVPENLLILVNIFDKYFTDLKEPDVKYLYDAKEVGRILDYRMKG